jgi:ankyrin repeat protein
VLLSKDRYNKTVWHKAAKRGNVELLKKLWDWAQELQLQPEDVKNDVLLSKDEFHETPWQNAAEMGQVEVLKELWNGVKNCS